MTSQLFANVYLNELDQFVKHDLKVRNYARYTDDFVIVSQNPEYLKNLVPSIDHFLRERLFLSLHPQKVTIRKYTQGVDFLGYVVFPHYVRVRKKTERRMFKKLKERIAAYRNGVISEQSLNGSLCSYQGVLSHAAAYEVEQELLNMFWFWQKE